MVSAGTKRKRRERGNRVAAAIEDGRTRAAAERKTLGKTITADVPDAELFTEDRKGKAKDALKQELYEQAVEQRRAAKRARRAAPKVRKSEAVLNKQETCIPISLPGKKKKGVGNVEMEILAKRKFDKPRGHVGNISEVIRQKKIYTDGKEDVWVGEMAQVVAKEIGLNRRRIAEKMNTAYRSAPSVIHPAHGLSINPTHEDHQDKLGEALADIVRKDDDDRWTDDKMKFDPALLQESTEGEVAGTGMKATDDAANDADESSDDESGVVKTVPERKTRSQRHKEARKREMVSNIAKKKANARRRKDLENLDKIADEANRLAEKLSGEEKLRKLRMNPPPRKGIDEPVFNKLSGQKVRNEAAVEPVTLSTELSENMRGVKMPVANPMLRDRFVSFERRGLIEPPKVLPKEVWRMEQKKRQDELKDKRKRKGRGSRSNMTFWRNGKRAIL